MDSSTTTPMLKQYHEIKAQYKDCILFFRLGDFYEMFYEDAKEAAPLLDVVLTSRGKGQASTVPMCGIPYHAQDAYIAKLIKAGKKVAICEQAEDPATAKGIVKREVVRVITSGTYIDEHSAEARYIICILPENAQYGFAFCDATEGVLYANQITTEKEIVELLAKLTVKELLFPEEKKDTIQKLIKNPLLAQKKFMQTPCEKWYFNPTMGLQALKDHFHVHSMKSFGIEDAPCAIQASAALLEYMKAMNKQPVKHIDRIALYSDSAYAFISPAAWHGLELESLLTTLDRTITPMGKRLFRQWLYHPLKSVDEIKERQAALRLFYNHQTIRGELSQLLRHLPDAEKHISRVSCGYTHAKDLLGLRTTLTRIPHLRHALLPFSEQNDLCTIPDAEEIRLLLENAINPELSLSHPEGTIIKKGYHEELDSLRDIQEHGREWLKKLQEEEIKRTSISSLKIGFNQVFGYYFEISKANFHLVPENYIRKQTLVNAERFITPQLKEFEEKMLGAESKIAQIEKELITTLAHKILLSSPLIHAACSSIARLDALLSLTELLTLPQYILPEVTTSTRIVITEGRHPVVESYAHEPFIPNDTTLDTTDNHLLLITGPNMAGKSTYIRQVAILAIMAQMGAPIPAKSAEIGIVDKFFTRIGAHDDIAKGQSTFMVEMSEAAGILNNLTPRSLVILDEIGRGTSTYDGLSLAWAIAEHIARLNIRTLFATHFHELMILSEDHKGVKNYNVAVKEWNDEVVFLHKIVAGGTDDSYGIYVAKLAGIPLSIVKRSQEILMKLEVDENMQNKIKKQRSKELELPLFQSPSEEVRELMEKIENIDINTMTPLEALSFLSALKSLVKKS